MTQSSKHSSRDTTRERERETDRQTDRQNMTCSALKYEHAKWVKEEGMQCFTQQIDEQLGYGILLVEKRDKDVIEIAYRVCVQKGNIEDEVEKQKRLVGEHIECGYIQCRQTHKVWWEQFWNRSSVNLPDKMFEKQWY